MRRISVEPAPRTTWPGFTLCASAIRSTSSEARAPDGYRPASASASRIASITFSDGPYALSLLSSRIGPPLLAGGAPRPDSTDIPAAALIPKIFRKFRREEDMTVLRSNFEAEAMQPDGSPCLDCPRHVRGASTYLR